MIQNSFAIDGRNYENYIVLTFTEGSQIKSIVVRFPEWWRFYDKRFQYYIPSHN